MVQATLSWWQAILETPHKWRGQQFTIYPGAEPEEFRRRPKHGVPRQTHDDTLKNSHLHFTCHLRWSLHSMVLVCLQYVQSVLCVMCVSLYVHPSLFCVHGHSWEKYFPYLCKKKSWKPFVKAGENFQCPETRNISGDLHSTTLWNLWPSACWWNQPFVP